MVHHMRLSKTLMYMYMYIHCITIMALMVENCYYQWSSRIKSHLFSFLDIIICCTRLWIYRFIRAAAVGYEIRKQYMLLVHVHINIICKDMKSEVNQTTNDVSNYVAPVKKKFKMQIYMFWAIWGHCSKEWGYEIRSQYTRLSTYLKYICKCTYPILFVCG